MKYFKLGTKLSVTALFWLLILSCGGNEKADKNQNLNELPDKEKVNVSLKENVVTVDEDFMSQLISVDKSSGVYLFSSDGDKLENLSSGSIVIFPGHSVRKVNKVEKNNNEYKVYTEFATLNQVINDGEISWEKKFSWGSGTDLSKASIFSGDFIFAAENNDGKVSYEGKIEGWDVSVELSSEAANRLNIEISASKKRGEQKVASLIATGWISDFENITSIIYNAGNLTQFKIDNKNLKGELEVKFAAQGLGSDVALIDLPAKISLPLRVGWVPVEIILKANLKMYPEVRENGSSIASYKLTYDTDMGFTFGNNQTNPSGKINSHDMAVSGETVSAGTITTGFGVGIEFPRFEISVLNELVVPYFLLNIHSSTFYEPGILSNLPPCQEGKMNFKSLVGLSMKLFSLSYEYQTVLWEKERKWQTEGSNCSD